jgi:hypothetical protein
MGTQQILLIVLSVIIVGVAIAVGITMFNNQAYNSNQQAVAAELQNYGSQVVQYWKTPISQGGVGQDVTVLAAKDIAGIAAFIGFDPTAGGADDSIGTENGIFTIQALDAPGKLVTLMGIGNNNRGGKYPKVTTIVNLTGDIISSTVATSDTYGF